MGSADLTAVLVVRARAGDGSAWEQIVDAYAGLVWAVARNHRLSDADAADVSQVVWLRLVENLDRVDDPRRLGAWLATTARRECLRVLRTASRQVPVAELDRVIDLRDVVQPPVDARLLEEEDMLAVRAAFAALPERCQTLLRLLVLDPPVGYDALSAALDMPVGSIGPTRGRCLDKLRRLVLAQGIALR